MILTQNNSNTQRLLILSIGHGEIIDGEEQPDRMKQLDDDGKSINSSIGSEDGTAVAAAVTAGTTAASKQNKKPSQLLKQFSRVSILDGHYMDVHAEEQDDKKSVKEEEDGKRSIVDIL